MSDFITLPNGQTFCKYYGGTEKTLESIHPQYRNRVGGPFCRVREYLDVSLINIEGVDLVQVCYDNGGLEGLYSLCGHYSIVGYYTEARGRFYQVYKCVFWRDNLQSTFGDYAQCKQHNPTLNDAVLQLKPLLK